MSTLTTWPMTGQLLPCSHLTFWQVAQTPQDCGEEYMNISQQCNPILDICCHDTLYVCPNMKALFSQDFQEMANYVFLVVFTVEALLKSRT